MDALGRLPHRMAIGTSDQGAPPAGFKYIPYDYQGVALIGAMLTKRHGGISNLRYDLSMGSSPPFIESKQRPVPLTGWTLYRHIRHEGPLPSRFTYMTLRLNRAPAVTVTYVYEGLYSHEDGMEHRRCGLQATNERGEKIIDYYHAAAKRDPSELLVPDEPFYAARVLEQDFPLRLQTEALARCLDLAADDGHSRHGDYGAALEAIVLGKLPWFGGHSKGFFTVDGFAVRGWRKWMCRPQSTNYNRPLIFHDARRARDYPESLSDADQWQSSDYVSDFMFLHAKVNINGVLLPALARSTLWEALLNAAVNNDRVAMTTIAPPSVLRRFGTTPPGYSIKFVAELLSGEMVEIDVKANTNDLNLGARFHAALGLETDEAVEVMLPHPGDGEDTDITVVRVEAQLKALQEASHEARRVGHFYVVAAIHDATVGSAFVDLSI